MDTVLCFYSFISTILWNVSREIKERNVIEPYLIVRGAISRYCRAITKWSTPISRKMQEVNFIPEGDIYRLIVKSQLPSAEKFETWVFDEVLP